MNAESTVTAAFLSEVTRARFDREIAKYPAEQKQSAVMACLAIVQQECGWIAPENEKAVADYLDMPAVAVHEVLTFYNMYNQHPVGRYKLTICTNVPCMFAGGPQALQYVCEKLGIEPGETTEDGMFTIQPCECLGACGDAPVLLVNDRNMCSFMSAEKLDQLIEGLRNVKE